MRRASLLVVAVVATACGGSASSQCTNGWIGTPSVSLSAAGAVYSLGLDGSVRRGGQAPANPAPAPGVADPSGRRTAIWQQRGKDPLLLRTGGRTRTLATQVATYPVWRGDGGALAFGQLVNHAIRLRVAEAAHAFRVRQLKLALCPLGGPA